MDEHKILYPPWYLSGCCNTVKVLSLGFQKEIYDPVTAVRRITEFNGTMAKLKLLIDHSLEDNATRLTHFTKFLKEKSINENSEHVYQDVILNNLASARESVTHSYEEITTRLALCQCKSNSRIL